MTDIIVLICCILGGFFVGRYTQSVINAKNQFYLDTLKYIENLQINIKTKQIGISSFNQEYSKICTSEFKAFLLDNKIEVRLSRAERKNILSLTNTMLDTSSDTLFSNLSFVSKLINDDYQLFYNSKFLKSKVYDKIGLLVGAIVGILLM